MPTTASAIRAMSRTTPMARAIRPAILRSWLISTA